MKYLLCIAMVVCLVGCSKEPALKHYEGKWTTDLDFIEDKIENSSNPELVRKLYAQYELFPRSWEIKDGAVYSGNERMTLEVFEDNVNYAEVLMCLHPFGHCVAKLRIRDNKLLVTYNPYDDLFLQFIREQ